MRFNFVGACATFALPLSGLALALGACLPHPDGDYEDFLGATASYRGADIGAGDGGGGGISDAGIGVVAKEGKYLAACLASLSGTRADKALRFYAETKFTPSEDGTTGTLGLVLYPFPVANTVFDKANTVGEPIDVGQLPVAADAKFNGVVAKSNITKEANTISPRDIVIENTKIAGLYSSEGTFCSSFDTTVTAPITQPIVAKCTYIPLETGATYEVLVPTGDSVKSAIIAGGVELTPEKFGCAN